MYDLYVHNGDHYIENAYCSIITPHVMIEFQYCVEGDKYQDCHVLLHPFSLQNSLSNLGPFPPVS